MCVLECVSKLYTNYLFGSPPHTCLTPWKIFSLKAIYTKWTGYLCCQYGSIAYHVWTIISLNLTNLHFSIIIVEILAILMSPCYSAWNHRSALKTFTQRQPPPPSPTHTYSKSMQTSNQREIEKHWWSKMFYTHR